MRPWFLDRFERVTGHDEQWRTACPRCGGHRALSFFTGDDRWIAKCYAGCPPRELLAIAELRFDDLLYESEPHHRGSSTDGRGGEHLRGSDVDRQSVKSQAEVEGLLERFWGGRLRGIVPVELAALPGDATETMRLVADFFALVHALREWAGMPREVPFSSYWVSGKLDLPQKTVWRALVTLVRTGVLADAGRGYGRDRKRGPRKYLPGDGAASAMPAEKAVASEDALPPGARSVEADDAGGVDEREEAGDDVPVRQAVADDGPEVPERHSRLLTVGDGAGGAVGGLVGHGSSPGNVPPEATPPAGGVLEGGR